MKNHGSIVVGVWDAAIQADGPRQDQVLHYHKLYTTYARLVIYKYYPITPRMQEFVRRHYVWTVWVQQPGTAKGERFCKTCQDVDILTIFQLLMLGSSSKWHPSINCFGFCRCRLLNPEPLTRQGNGKSKASKGKASNAQSCLSEIGFRV